MRDKCGQNESRVSYRKWMSETVSSLWFDINAFVSFDVKSQSAHRMRVHERSTTKWMVNTKRHHRFETMNSCRSSDGNFPIPKFSVCFYAPIATLICASNMNHHFPSLVLYLSSVLDSKSFHTTITFCCIHISRFPCFCLYFLLNFSAIL